MKKKEEQSMFTQKLIKTSFFQKCAINKMWDVKRELIKIFTGTATSCFDADGKPINRPNSII